MGLEIESNPLPGVYTILPPRFEDDRGFFMETFHWRKYKDLGVPSQFVQDNWSRSKYGVLRGLHYQRERPQAKLVYVLNGVVFDVVVDIREGSPTFGQWFGCELSGDNRRQLLIPEGFAHGFCALSETADLCYKCSDWFDPEDDRGLHYQDPAFAIEWPLQEVRLSPKDEQLPTVSEVSSDYLPTYPSNERPPS